MRYGNELQQNKALLSGRKNKRIQTRPQMPQASIVQITKLVNNKHVFVVLKRVGYLLASW